MGKEGSGLTTHSSMCTHGSMGPSRVTKKARDITTIQLTPQTRDRLYRLKFRKTYDEFLAELCDLYEVSGRDAQK